MWDPSDPSAYSTSHPAAADSDTALVIWLSVGGVLLLVALGAAAQLHCEADWAAGAVIGCWYWRHNSSVQFCQVPTAETDFDVAPRKEIEEIASVEDTQEVTINELETETRDDDDVAIGISKRSGI